MNVTSLFSRFRFNAKGSKYRSPNKVVDLQSSTDKKKSLKMDSGSHCIPKKRDWNSKGEDAHFISGDGNVVGVADGVGSWANEGVDSGEYSRTLMKNAAAAAKRSGGLTPKEMIVEAFRATKVEAGSSTACVVAHDDGELTSANVGDSGFVVFRRDQDDKPWAARSEAQHHRFNCPYQLGNGGCGYRYDPPECAAEMSVAVEEGDVVVVGTDGVFDNIYVAEIGAMVRSGRKEGLRPRELAKKIAKLAKRNSDDRQWESPFAREAKLAGLCRRGGKKYDITVVVGVILRS